MVLATQDIPGRRLKILRIASEMFISLFLQDTIQSYKIVSGGFPSDAKLVSVAFVEERFVDCWIESETFDRVPFGDPIPLMDAPVVARI